MHLRRVAQVASFSVGLRMTSRTGQLLRIEQAIDVIKVT